MRAQHANVVRVLDHGLHREKGREPAPFYVTPFHAESLRTVMERRIRPAEVLPAFAQGLDGVEAAHLKSVVHRDLKPENILHDPVPRQLVVADFGIAEFSEEELYTLVETKLGTRFANFAYAAPEQKRRGAACDRRTDIFALGMILNEMFTDALPLGTGYAEISSVAPEYSYLDSLVGEMIRQNPSDRPATIDAIKRELIGRRNDFVTRQELSALTKQVVPTGTVDDPLVADPVRVVDANWAGGTLTIVLSQRVNPDWVQILQFGPYGRESIWGRGPDAFSLSGDRASVSVKSDDAQRALDYFKGWLRPANELYKRHIEQRKAGEEKVAREQLAQQIRVREEQLAVNSRLRAVL